MTSRDFDLSRALLLGLASLVALLLAWRIVVSGVDALRQSDAAPAQNATSSPLDVQKPDAALRQKLARNPADYAALLALALQLEREGNKKGARDAAAEALRLAPSDQGVLIQTAFLYLRTGDETSGLSVLRRFVELPPTDSSKIVSDAGPNGAPPL